jgi:hypothetical protein
MKKQRVSPTTPNVLTGEILKKSFATTGDFPSVETIDKAVAMVTNHVEQKVSTERNERKRETIKGTILQSVMIDKDLLKKVKHTAFYNEKSISEVVNQALRLFYD